MRSSRRRRRSIVIDKIVKNETKFIIYVNRDYNLKMKEGLILNLDRISMWWFNSLLFEKRKKTFGPQFLKKK
jgi:hypothetical protein